MLTKKLPLLLSFVLISIVSLFSQSKHPLEFQARHAISTNDDGNIIIDLSYSHIYARPSEGFTFSAGIRGSYYYQNKSTITITPLDRLPNCNIIRDYEEADITMGNNGTTLSILNYIRYTIPIIERINIHIYNASALHYKLQENQIKKYKIIELDDSISRNQRKTDISNNQKLFFQSTFGVNGNIDFSKTLFLNLGIAISLSTPNAPELLGNQLLINAGIGYRF